MNWQKILNHLKIDDRDILSSISLLPASIIVSEALFCEKKQDVDLLRSVHQIDLNTVLQRLCNLDLFDIFQQIAQIWEMPQSISDILQAASGLKASEDETINNLGKWMHLLLFYTLSQPKYIKQNLMIVLVFPIEIAKKACELLIGEKTDDTEKVFKLTYPLTMISLSSF